MGYLGWWKWKIWSVSKLLSNKESKTTQSMEKLTKLKWCAVSLYTCWCKTWWPSVDSFECIDNEKYRSNESVCMSVCTVNWISSLIHSNRGGNLSIDSCTETNKVSRYTKCSYWTWKFLKPQHFLYFPICKKSAGICRCYHSWNSLNIAKELSIWKY